MMAKDTHPRQQHFILFQVLAPHPPWEQSQALFTHGSSLPQADSKVLAFINIIRKRETASKTQKQAHLSKNGNDLEKTKLMPSSSIQLLMLPCFLLHPLEFFLIQ